MDPATRRVRNARPRPPDLSRDDVHLRRPARPTRRARAHRRGHGPRHLLLAGLLATALLAAWASLGRAGQGPPAPHAHRNALAARGPAAGGRGLLPGLAGGACRAFTPLGRRRRGVTVFVDPGHGGVDPGAVGSTAGGTPVEEKNVTLAVGLDLLARLRSDGYAVVMSRTTDTTVAPLGPDSLGPGGLTVAAEHLDTEARVDCANASGARLLVSIHMNAFQDPAVGGTETVYDSARPFSAASARFASAVQKDVAAALANRGWTVADRGVKDDSTLDPPTHSVQAASYGHLLELGPPQSGWLAHPSLMPGALIEPLFVTDPGEAALALDPRCQGAIAGALQAAVDAYFTAPAEG